MSSVTTLFAPITQRSPTRDAAGDHDVGAAPDVVADPRRPLAGEALPGDRPDPGRRSGGSRRSRSSRSRTCSGRRSRRGSAAATMTAMLRNVPEPIRMRPSSEVVSQTSGSNSVCSPTSSRPSRKRLEHVPVERPARERPAPGKLTVDGEPVPRERVALVPEPLLPPEAGVLHRGSFPDMTTHAILYDPDCGFCRVCVAVAAELGPGPAAAPGAGRGPRTPGS